MGNDQKVLENRLRRVAKRRGLTVSKNRVRDPKAIGYELYKLRSSLNEITLSCLTLDELAECLK